MTDLISLHRRAKQLGVAIAYADIPNSIGRWFPSRHVIVLDRSLKPRAAADRRAVVLEHELAHAALDIATEHAHAAIDAASAR